VNNDIKIADITPIKHLSMDYVSNYDEDVLIAEISDSPINGFKGMKQVHSVLIPLDELDTILSHKGCCIGWSVNSWGPKPCVDEGEVFNSSFWVDSIDKDNNYEPLIHTWTNNNKTVLLPDNGLLMCYGLVPRNKGKSSISWDDPSKPLYDVVVVNSLSNYAPCTHSPANISIRKDYLEDFCSLKSCAAVAIFYEERFSRDDESINKILGKDRFKSYKLNSLTVHIQKLDFEAKDSNQLVKVWGCRLILKPKKRPILGEEKKSFMWPDYDDYISKENYNSWTFPLKYVYIKDEALISFQNNSDYLIYPESGDLSYGNWWSTDRSRRIGRNYILMELKKIYEGTPLNIIEHINKFAVSKELAQRDKSENNISTRTKLLIDSFIRLGQALEELSNDLQLFMDLKDIISLDSEEIDYNGWYTIDYFKQLSNVSLESMNKYEFLERCVTLFKLLEHIKVGNLRSILKKLGLEKKKVNDFGSLKLLGTLVQLSSIAKEESLSLVEDKDLIIKKWDEKKMIVDMNSLFALNGLRVFQSHINSGSSDEFDSKLKVFNLELQNMIHGWGKGLDSVYDELIISLENISELIYRNR